jgi:hypothetical protein
MAHTTLSQEFMDDGELETDKLILFYIKSLVSNATPKQRGTLSFPRTWLGCTIKFSSTVQREKREDDL